MTLNASVILSAAAARHPDRVAVVADAVGTTYAELDERADRVGTLLVSLGVTNGDGVALVLPNCPDFAAIFFGVLRCGATAVPVNKLASRREIEHVLRDSEARVLFTTDECGANAIAAAASVGVSHVFMVGDSAGKIGESFDAALRRCERLPDARVTMPHDDAVILYTSGTTGQPKGACLPHSSVAWITEVLATRTMAATERDVFLGALPLSHIFGLVAVLCVSTMVGGCVVLQDRFEPEQALELMVERRVTVFEGVPAMCRAVLAAQRARRCEPPSALRLAFLGGQSTPVEVLRQFEATFGCSIIECYGTTETGASISATPGHDASGRYAGTVGTPLWGVSVKIADEDGTEVKAGELGEILVKSIGSMTRYNKNEKATAESLRDGWFHTGDIGVIDERGLLSVVDRKKELIIRGGYNVYPREIEEIPYEHPSVTEAAVVGVPDERIGEEVAAVVALHAGATATETELKEFVRERVSSYKYPRIVSIVDELPKTSTGKLSKKLIDRGGLTKK